MTDQLPLLAPVLEEFGIVGGRLLVLQGGRAVIDESVGVLQKWDVDDQLTPDVEAGAVTPDARYDLASVTKLFTTSTLFALVGAGRIDLEGTLAAQLPTYSGSADITIRQLLTHTAGMPPVLPLWELADTSNERRDIVLKTAPVTPPGSAHAYSCVGFMLLGFLIKHVTQLRLDDAMKTHIIGPLGLRQLGYLPGVGPRRIAATEDESYVGRGMLRGSVHDEACWSLGEVAGNAGLFGTAADLATFGEMLRLGGVHPGDGRRLLPAELVAQMGLEQPGPQPDGLFRQGLGARVHQIETEEAGWSDAFGHSGFTGTYVATSPAAELTIVLLTNSVHPHRGVVDTIALRRAVCARVAERLV